MSKLAEKYTAYLMRNHIIKTEQVTLYMFGFEQILFGMLNILTAIAVSLLFNMLWQCVVFMAAYFLLRVYAGGYHAKTKTKCYLLSTCIVVVSLVTIRFMPWSMLLCFTCMAISGGIIYWLAPVESIGKPLDAIEHLVFKKRTRTRLGLLSGIGVCSWVFGLQDVSHCISVAFLQLSIMLIL